MHENSPSRLKAGNPDMEHSSKPCLSSDRRYDFHVVDLFGVPDGI